MRILSRSKTPLCATSLVAAMLLACAAGHAQSSLQQKVAAIATAAQGKVAAACALPGSSLNCDLDPHAHPPMQSVFKFPLAITALHFIEQGKFTLDQPIRFEPADRFFPKTYSPLQDKYPDANVDVPLRELLRLSASLSDNAAADLILRVIGGPGVVDSYIKSLGIEGFHLEDSEHGLHADWKAQYRNGLEPAAAVQLLLLLSGHSPLTREHSALLLEWMKDSPTGAHLIQAQLPEGTTVMHKSGRSGTRDGLTAATNDITLVTLPGGRRMAIAVFVTDSTADENTRDAVIARIARAAYDAATQRPD